MWVSGHPSALWLHGQRVPGSHLSLQPGRKSLLLKMCLNPGVGDTRTPSTSPAQQRILGVERARAVLAYRVLKQQRQQAAR